MMLVSIHLFLRNDEFSTMETSHIERDLCVFKDGVLKCLAVRAQGKTDDIPRVLLFWKKDDCLELCPIRHLLSYIYLAKISSGLLFPNLKDKSKVLDYNYLSDTLKTRFRDVLDRDQSITMHTFRHKSTYS